MIKSKEIREKFLDFFESNGHKIINSSPLIPDNDPSLLFTNAGMVQFKNIFTGKEKSKFLNVVSAQKCIRAGGKHNDLNNVGYTPRHHTFFEMLGNFSFGSYFKQEAIEFAWKFLTKDCLLKPEKLVVTVYEEDIDSFKIWKKLLSNKNTKIIKISSSDNFWSMGEKGPCGPCSEIFYDNGEKIYGGLPGSKEQEGERFVEVWNLVFMQFEKNGNKLKELPKKCVDTGMGLERITAVLNGLTNNFETDIFLNLINKIEELTKISCNSQNIASFRIISDHMRSIVFLISEGLIPSNEGRGYVLRRIIRRAARHISLIGFEKSIMYKLVEYVCCEYNEIYFDLKQNEKYIIETLENEEKKFSLTLKDGLRLLNFEIKNLKTKNFPEKTAFKLYDTYGFPYDMTENILKENNLTLDMKKLQKIINKQKFISKKTWRGSGDLEEENVLIELKNKFEKTNFLGYEHTNLISKLIGIVNKGSFTESVFDGDSAYLIFESTPFFAESGGQIGDSGKLLCASDNSVLCEICKTIKIEGDIFLHDAKNIKKKLYIHNSYELLIDKESRNKIRNNHSATHLLNESLRRILGDHIKQKGSLVSESKLRFDYSHNSPLTQKEIFLIEDLVNSQIRENLKINIKFMKPKDAIESGTLGLFGEKYPDLARVVNMSYSDSKKIDSFSSELCGGTHVDFTGEIGYFKILSDTSISSGVRRIEAITGEYAQKFINQKVELITNLAFLVKTDERNILEKIKNLLQENKSLKSAEAKNNEVKLNEKFLSVINGISVYCQEVETNSKEIKKYADQVKLKNNSCASIIINRQDKKITFLISLTDDLTKKLDAQIIARKVSSILGGKGGGGRKDLAQGGGIDVSKLNDAFSFFKDLFKENF